MNAAWVVTASLVMLTALGLVAWAWFAMTQAEMELRSFMELNALQLEN